MSKTVYYTDDFEANSSVINHVYYDAKRNELYVLLHSGAVCGYLGVPQNTFDQFKRTDSAGSFWNAYVKWNFRGTSGDVNFTKAEPAVESNDDTEQAGGKGFTVLVHVEGDLKFDLDAEDLLSATKNVHDLVSKSVVEGAFFVKEVKAN